MPRLTQVAHDLLKGAVKPGDRVIDATAGNGHDTLFLARCVGGAGKVLAIDCQQQALENTHQRLVDAGVQDRVTLVEGDHAKLLLLTPQDWRSKVAAIIFNLGYLPGSDKQVVTTPTSTRQALDACLEILAPGGLLLMLIYRGHIGGHDEEAMIQARLRQRANDFQKINWNDGDFPNESSPRLLTAQKR